MRHTLVTPDAVFNLTVSLQSAVVFDEETTARFPEILRLRVINDAALIDAFVIETEVRRDINAVWTRHAVLARSARNDRIFQILISYIHQ